MFFGLFEFMREYEIHDNFLQGTKLNETNATIMEEK